MAYPTVLLLLLAALACAQKEPNKPSVVYMTTARIVAQLCKASVNASDADVEKVARLEELTTETELCLQYCVFHLLGVQSGTKFSEPSTDFVYLFAHILEDLPKALRTKRIVAECIEQLKGIKSDDKCYLAGRFEDCFRKVNTT